MCVLILPLELQIDKCNADDEKNLDEVIVDCKINRIWEKNSSVKIT